MSYFFVGPNPTVDLAIFRRSDQKILLIQRGKDPYKGTWALPGGFQNTHAKPGGLWKPGAESAVEAALREAREETGLEILRPPTIVGVYEGNGRDPRDSDEAWSRSTAFYVLIEDAKAQAGDDADDVNWFSPEALPPLAFDHSRIISDAIRSIRGWPNEWSD